MGVRVLLLLQSRGAAPAVAAAGQPVGVPLPPVNFQVDRKLPGRSSGAADSWVSRCIFVAGWYEPALLSFPLEMRLHRLAVGGPSTGTWGIIGVPASSSRVVLTGGVNICSRASCTIMRALATACGD